MGLNIGIGIGVGFSTSRPAPSVADLLCQAIGAKRQISATHKGKAIRLAPHVTYWHGSNQADLFLDAVVEGGNKPKLSTFKLSELSGTTVLATTFEPFARFHPDDPKYLGKTRCIVQRV